MAFPSLLEWLVETVLNMHVELEMLSERDSYRGADTSYEMT